MSETNATNIPVVLQLPTSVKALIEALIFGAREPLSVRQIQALYEVQGTGGEPRMIDYEEIIRSVEDLNAEYSASDRPYRIIQIAGGYQFATLPLYAEWLGKLYKEQTRRKLSQSSVETLAIIAYKQPITKPEIESIRGVNCDYVLSTLLEKDLATIVGRAPTVGRPLLYGTSKEFLRHFGLNDLNDLPRPREIQEILGDSQFETERRMLEAQQGGEEKKEEDFKSRLPHIPKRKAGLDSDVKILPKKRVRDIKVLPTDEAETAKTEETGSEQQAIEPLETPPALATLQKKGELIEAPETPTVQEFPKNEDISGVATEERDERPVMPNVPETFGSPEYVEMPLSPETEQIEIEASSMDAVLAETDESQPSATAEVPADKPAPESMGPELSDRSDELPSVVSIRVEEDITTTSDQAELQVSEEPIVQELNDAGPLVTHENVIEQIPQAVASTIEEHEEMVPAGEPRMLAEEPRTDSEVPHPKTRWKSWKEKIQGFIKKLFG